MKFTKNHIFRVPKIAKTAFFELVNSPIWFHAKSEWQTNPEFSTLCNWFHETFQTTVWKFHDFSIIQILRKIKIGDSKSAKCAIFTLLEALNLDYFGFLHFLKAEIHQKPHFQCSKKCKNSIFWTSPNLISRKIWVTDKSLTHCLTDFTKYSNLLGKLWYQYWWYLLLSEIDCQEYHDKPHYSQKYKLILEIRDNSREMGKHHVKRSFRKRNHQSFELWLLVWPIWKLRLRLVWLIYTIFS